MNHPNFSKLKTVALALILTISSSQLFAQTGNGIFFQAVARDNFSNPAKDRSIYVQTTILQSTTTGTKVLIEEHKATTDATGVFSISIGNGTRVGGTAANLNGIDWSKGPFFLNLKVAITPVGGTSSWDYTKEWVDMGTTNFGAVPFSFYAASVAGFDTKLNVSDSAKMLLPYAKSAALNTLSSSIDNNLATKLNIADSTNGYVTKAQLLAKTFDTTSLSNRINIKANTNDVIASLSTKLNIADSVIKYITPTQLASYNFSSGGGGTTIDTTFLSNRINLKANASDLTSGLALKANASDVTTALNLKANASDLTSGLALKANASDVTTSLNLKANASDVTSALSLKASTSDLTSGLALKANSSSLATVATSGDYNDLANKPTIAGSYTLPTASASTLGGIKVGTNLSIDGSGVLSANISSGAINATSVNTPIYVSTPQTLTDASIITWDPTLGLNANVTLGGNRTLSFSSTPPSGSYGTIVITQDANGGRTITLPSTANKILGSTSTTSIALSTAAGAKDILNFYYDGTNCYWNIGQGYGTAATAASTNLATSVSGTLAVANGGTGATTLTGLVKGSGTSAFTAAVAGTDYQEPITLTTTGTGAATLSGTILNIPSVSSTVNAGSISGTVAIANGGTGLSTTPANGQIDIGNGTGFSRTTLTAGSGISITNASGAITIASSGAAGVPYSGANQAVDLGAYDLTVNGLTIGKGKKDAGTAYQYNSAIGVNALSNFSGGTKNTALGHNALASVTSTDQNIAIGVNAMGSTTQYFQQSVAVGNQALQYNQGSFNTALGANSLSASGLTSAATYLVGVGALALWNNTSGQNNTGIGSYALGSNTTGNNNSALGQGADVSSGNLNNATAIGYNARVSASNTIQLGNTSVTNVNTSGTVTAGAVTYPSIHGTTGQVLTTTGSGTLTFATPAVAKPISDQFTATAAQTSFTLSQTPITNTTVSPNVKPNVWMYINGIRTNNSAYSISGTTVTYTAANNNNYTIVVGDRIQFDYAY